MNKTLKYPHANYRENHLNTEAQTDMHLVNRVIKERSENKYLPNRDFCTNLLWLIVDECVKRPKINDC